MSSRFLLNNHIKQKVKGDYFCSGCVVFNKSIYCWFRRLHHTGKTGARHSVWHYWSGCFHQPIKMSARLAPKLITVLYLLWMSYQLILGYLVLLLHHITQTSFSQHVIPKHNNRNNRESVFILLSATRKDGCPSYFSLNGTQQEVVVALLLPWHMAPLKLTMHSFVPAGRCRTYSSKG